MSTPITHIVSFRYKNPASALEAAGRFEALATECKLDYGKGEPYILSFSGGSDCSPEGRAKGLQHTFILVFPNIESRDYYLDEDPAHQASKQFVRPLVEDSFVFDFVQGVYTVKS